jgi:hypothetical protein
VKKRLITFVEHREVSCIVLLPDDESLHQEAIDELRNLAEGWEWKPSEGHQVASAHEATIPEYTYSDGEWYDGELTDE